MTDTQVALAADTTVLLDLEKGCKTRIAEWEERSKTRSEELVARADTIMWLMTIRGSTAQTSRTWTEQLSCAVVPPELNDDLPHSSFLGLLSFCSVIV